jgi:hypothetical protein
MPIRKYKIIGDQLSKEKFIQKLDTITEFQDENGRKYKKEERKIKSNLTFRTSGGDIEGIHYIALGKLYNHYCIIAENTKNPKDMTVVSHINELGMRLLMKANLIVSD